MSRLQLHGRPFVVFDAKNKEHRRWFANFNRTLSWSDCPVRFVVNDDHGDLITMIQRELIAHYVDKEFGQLKVIVQKAKRTVSKRNSTKIDIKSN